MQRIRARVFPWREHENDTAVEQGVPRAKGDSGEQRHLFFIQRSIPMQNLLYLVFNQIHFHLGRSVLLKAGAVL